MQFKAQLDMELSSLQSVRIFGWWAQPRLTLAWEDVKTTGKTWKQLRDLGISANDLKTIQPDKQEWISRGGVQGTDLRDMKVFPVNPIVDFRADLAELWQLGFSAEELVEMQVNISQLISKGLSPAIMYYFNYDLAGWWKLGLTQYHVDKWTEAECAKVFGIKKAEVGKILEDF